MNNPTPLHPVATTQAGELPKLPECIWHAFCTKCGKSDDFQCEPGSYICGCGYARLITQSKMYTAEQMDAHALAAIEMQASHSAADDSVPVCLTCGGAGSRGEVVCWDCEGTGNRANPPPTTAPTFEPESERTPLSAAILESLYKDAQRGFSVERVHATLMGLINSTTAPAATTPAASSSIDSTSFMGRAIAAAVEAMDVGPGAEWESFIAHISAHTAAQVAIEKAETKRMLDTAGMYQELYSKAVSAAQVAANTPAEAPEPEFSIDPDGELCLDWYVGGATLSVSIGGNGKLAWVADSGSKTTSGTKGFSKPAAASGEALPLMRAAFVTSESDGAGRYSLRFKFKTMGDMHCASDQWFKYCEALAAPQHQVQAGGDAPDGESWQHKCEETERALIYWKAKAKLLEAATPPLQAPALPATGEALTDADAPRLARILSNMTAKSKAMDATSYWNAFGPEFISEARDIIAALKEKTA